MGYREGYKKKDLGKKKGSPRGNISTIDKPHNDRGILKGGK